MEARQLLAADVPLGATPVDTGEFLLGTVTVTPVFFESDGSIDPKTQHWADGEIDQLLVKVRESVDWWSDLLATKTSKHSLSFEIDDTYAKAPVQTGYEPIDRPSTTFQRYVGDWLTDLGYGDAPSIERAVHLFNDSQREKKQTDWAFTIFIVDSSEDDDGFFASGGFIGAFAYPGGLFYVVPSERPVSTYTHEMGHIFWGRDEYPGAGSWTDQRGYYNAQNLNAADNETPGFEQQVGIMRGGSVAIQAFEELVSPPSTLAMIGWRDSDGDGVFDLADVPLELDAVGWFDTQQSVYSIRGSAGVSLLANQNSDGMQSDITLARVGALQYKLDEGQWQTVLTPDDTHVDFDLQIPVPTDFDQIQWRAIDTNTGVTSSVLSGDALTPVSSGIGGGFAFVDQNGNGQREFEELLIAGTQFTIRRGDGSGLFYRAVQASNLPDGVIDSSTGLTLTSQGDHVDGRIAVLPSTDPQYGQVFQAFDTRRSEWKDKWGAKRKLNVTAEQATGHVAIDFVALDSGSYGLESGSYARVEAFDGDGNRIDRVTSGLVLAGQHATLVVEDSLGRIASVVVYGHAETEILVSSIAWGHQAMMSSDHGGAFSVDGLSDGAYSVELVSPNLIYQFPAQPVEFQISGGAVSTIEIAAQRVDSPRHNSAQPGDVNGDQEITLRDALAIINDLGRLGNRTLSPGETTGLLVDVNNDGAVSALDALRVINQLAVESGSEGELISPPPGVDSVPPEFTQAQQASVSPDSDLAAPPLAAAAVDQVFWQTAPENDDDQHRMDDRENPKMLNSAGEPTSDQSPIDRLSDRTLEADVLRSRQNGPNVNPNPPVSESLLENAVFHGISTVQPSPDELF